MMGRTQLTIHAERCLRKAGWFPGRCIDVSEMEWALSKEGLYVNEAARAFLREFGDLRVTRRFSDSSLFGRCMNWLNHRVTPADRFSTCLLAEPISMLYCFGRGRIGWVERYREKVGDLCLVGEYGTIDLELFIAVDGSLYFGYDQLLRQIGVDATDGINRLCDGMPWSGEEIDVMK